MDLLLPLKDKQITLVQQWAGHKDLRTTLRYAHVGADHERAAIQRLSFSDSVANEADQA
jgi:hypothetical protein